MHFLLKIGDMPASYVRFPEGIVEFPVCVIIYIYLCIIYIIICWDAKPSKPFPVTAESEG